MKEATSNDIVPATMRMLQRVQRITQTGNWIWIIKNGEKNNTDELWWTDEIYNIFGIKRGSFKATYQAFLGYVHPDDRKLVNDAVINALRNPLDALHQEYDIKHRIVVNGQIKWVREKATVERKGGQPVRMDGVVQDINEQQQEEDKKNALHKISNIALKIEPLEKQLQEIFETILGLSWLTVENKGCILIATKDNNGKDVLGIQAQVGLPDWIKKQCGFNLHFGECLCGLAARQQEVIFADHVDNRHVNRPDNPAEMPDHGHYCIPIMFADKVLGVIDLYLSPGHARKEEEIKFLISAANTIAMLIINKQREEELKENKKELERIVSVLKTSFDSLPIGTMVTDNRMLIVESNPAFCKMWSGREQDPDFELSLQIHDITNESGSSCLDQPSAIYFSKKLKDPKLFKDLVAELFHNQELRIDRSIEFLDGTILKFTSVPQKLENGRIIGRVWLFEDITKQTLREIVDTTYASFSSRTHGVNNLEEICAIMQEEVCKVIYVAKDNLSVFIFDEESRIINMVHHCEGGKKQDRDIRAINDDEKEYDLTELVILKKLPQLIICSGYVPAYEFKRLVKEKIVKRHGSDKGDWWGVLITDHNDKVIGMIIIEGENLIPHPHFQRLLSQMSDLMAKIIINSLLNTTDPLTSLLNRLAFHLIFENVLAISKRDKEDKFTLMLLDLDGFKEVNDIHGHDAGDAVLKEMGRRFKKCIRGSDVAARIGGDEFTLLLRKIADEKTAGIVAEKIITAVNQPVPFKNKELIVGVSIGIIFSDQADKCDDLKSCADKAMYKSKHDGKNCYTFYNKELQMEGEIKK